MKTNNPFRNGNKPVSAEEGITTELSSVVDNTVRYARLFWSLLGLIAVVFGLVYTDRYVSRRIQRKYRLLHS